MHEVHVQLLNHLRVIEQHLRHEGPGLKVAPSLELKHVPFRADYPTVLEAPQEVARVRRARARRVRRQR